MDRGKDRIPIVGFTKYSHRVSVTFILIVVQTLQERRYHRDPHDGAWQASPHKGFYSYLTAVDTDKSGFLNIIFIYCNTPDFFHIKIGKTVAKYEKEF